MTPRFREPAFSNSETVRYIAWAMIAMAIAAALFHFWHGDYYAAIWAGICAAGWHTVSQAMVAIQEREGDLFGLMQTMAQDQEDEDDEQ